MRRACVDHTLSLRPDVYVQGRGGGGARSEQFAAESVRSLFSFIFSHREKTPCFVIIAASHEPAGTVLTLKALLYQQ